MAGVEHPTAAAPPPVRRTGIPLGRVLGFPLHLSWTVLLLAALVTLLYGQFGSYLVGFGFVVLLLGSVLLHELGHAVTARRLGIGVRGITLEILGGYTEMERDAPSPRVELLVALAGPAVSLVLGLGAAAAAVVLPAGTAVFQVAFLVALANVIVAFFNVLPGLPLDGGRALRAAVWAASGSQLRGTLVAARSGQGVGVLTGVGAVVLYGTGWLPSEFGLIFLLVVAFTLWQGAAASAKVARVQARVPLIDIDELTRPIFPVPSGTPLGEAQRRAAASGGTRAALAVADSSGRLIALVDNSAAEAVPQARRPWVAVDTVARDLSSLRSVPAGLRGPQALAFLQADPAGEYLVRSGEEVVGVLRARDVARLLRARPRREHG
jgi:Zn-dependent protease